MNDIERAIELLNNTYHRQDQFKYIDLAIQALQEKAEREALQSKCISCKDRKASVTVSDLFCNSCGRKLPREATNDR